ncbi:MAG: phosphatase [Bacteroidetes bacterium]|nr:MAG: phosphatase [Bacteroidota bacterium]
MILAAIDIGSNAIRLQITRIIWHKGESPVYKVLESIRFPLRLGKDAFRTGEITFRSEVKFINLMMAFRTLIDLYEADDVYGCGTSALRDSINGQRIIDRSYEKSGIHIEIISGEREAEILDKVVHKDLGDGHFMHIDVGGGSTEINMINEKKSYARKSFKLGSVRNMQGKESPSTWEAMETWILENRIDPFEATIATGGNIRTLQKLILGQNEELVDIEQMEAMIDHVNSLSIEERIEKLGLREDRADVIPYASEIYLTAMATAGTNKILVPNVGLKDGIIEMLVERNS